MVQCTEFVDLPLMYMGYIILILAWSGFYFLHSLLATNAIKKRSGLKPRAYRLLYNGIAGITFAMVLYLSMLQTSRLLLAPTGWIKTVGLLLAVWGVWIIKLSFRYYDFRSFAGLKAEEKPMLQKSGLMKFVRHPIYLGTLMILAGFFFYSPTTTVLIIFGVSLVYVFIGIKLEESKLLDEFGTEYEEYRENVPMIFPFLKF